MRPGTSLGVSAHENVFRRNDTPLFVGIACIRKHRTYDDNNDNNNDGDNNNNQEL